MSISFPTHAFSSELYLYYGPNKHQKACVLKEHTLFHLGGLPQLKDALDLTSWLDVQKVL